MKRRLPIFLVSKCTFVQALGLCRMCFRLTQARLAVCSSRFSRIVRAHNFCQHAPVTIALLAFARWRCSLRNGSAGICVYEFRTGTRVKEIKRSYNTALRLAGIDGLVWQDLRATFGTRLGEAGYDTFTISSLM